MKTKTLIGFLVVSLVIVGTYVFQQNNSSESETTPVSQNGKDMSQPQTAVSSAQKTAKEEPVTVKGKVSVSFE